MTNQGDEPAVCRLTIEINGTTLFDSETGGVISIGQHRRRAPALICAYDFNSIRLMITDRVIETLAIREVAEVHGYCFDMNDVKSWHKIGEERPDLIGEAKQLEFDPLFALKFLSEITGWVDRIMGMITPGVINKCLDISFQTLVAQSMDNVMKATRIGAGIEPRKAKARQRPVVNLARNLASSIGGISRPGRTKGKGSKAPRFTYATLYNAVCELGKDEIPNQMDVARRMGYKGSNADDQLRTELRRRSAELKARGHRGHRWKPLVKEILSEFHK